MSKYTNDSNSIDSFIKLLEPELAAIAEAIRKLILTSDQEIGEQIKWNSPSFFFKGKMKAFNPKEYKRDIAVMNIRKGRVMLVLPTGAKIKDESGFLEGHYTDGRRLVTFSSLKDVKTRGTKLQEIIRIWLSMVE